MTIADDNAAAAAAAAAGCDTFESCRTYRSCVVEWTASIVQRVQDWERATSSQFQQQLNQKDDGRPGHNPLHPPPTAAAVTGDWTNDADCSGRPSRHAARFSFSTVAPPPEGTSHDHVRQQYAFRSLSASECDALQKGGNRIPASAQLFAIVPHGQKFVDQSPLLARHVFNNTLEGFVVWTFPAEAPTNSSATTAMVNVENNRISNSIVHLDAAIVYGSTVAGTYIGPRAIVENSRLGVMAEGTAVPPTTTLECRVGAESGGGRVLHLTLESSMDEVARQLLLHDPASGAPFSPSPKLPPLPFSGSDNDSTTVSLYRAGRFLLSNFVGTGARITEARCVRGAFLFPQSSIDGASTADCVSLHPNAYLGAGVVVRHCLLQWRARIIDVSVVSYSILLEGAVVGPHSTVHQSVLGPDAHVSCGEVHASVLGPNLNAHHQSLIIGVLWPSGRGNVGYGANVGSNHTGRSPDQEALVGEGVFWGLGCVVKFPVCVAPYTIVAAGTVLPPQRMTMPFSLVVTSSSNASRNDLLPGWVLGSSPYTVARAVQKLATRRTARRHATGWPVLRPSLIQQCVVARDTLAQSMEHLSSSEGGGAGTSSSSSIPGIGACHVSDKARAAGVRAYTDCVQRFALRGLLAFVRHTLAPPTASSSSSSSSSSSQWIPVLQRELSSGWTPLPPTPKPSSSRNDRPTAHTNAPWETLPWQEDTSDAHVWAYQKSLLHSEFPMSPTDSDHGTVVGDAYRVWLLHLFQRLIELESQYARQVYECKRRDDVRGRQTIPGYAEAHVAADQDPVIAIVRKEAEEVVNEARKILDLLVPTPCSQSKL